MNRGTDPMELIGRDEPFLPNIMAAHLKEPITFTDEEEVSEQHWSDLKNIQEEDK